jgi:hypothetical protein
VEEVSIGGHFGKLHDWVGREERPSMKLEN